MRLGGKEPEYPEIGSDAYLIGWLGELGWVAHIGMGGAPLTFSEIGAWSSMTGIPLRKHPIPEASWLHAMSSAYFAEIQKSKWAETPQPYE